MEYAPFTLDIEETGLLKAAKELGVAVVAYSPLGRGLLTGQYVSEPEAYYLTTHMILTVAKIIDEPGPI